MDKNQKDLVTFFSVGLVLIIIVVFLMFGVNDVSPEPNKLGSPFTDVESRERLYEHFEYEITEFNIDTVGDFERDLVTLDVKGTQVVFKTSFRGFDLQDRMAFVGEIEIVEPAELNNLFNEKFADTLFSLEELRGKLEELVD